ncbi:MAG: hypothetical protein OCD02_15575 [Spirochaetaceae bacterium]
MFDISSTTLHVLFATLGIVLALFVIIKVFKVKQKSNKNIFIISCISTVSICFSYLFGGLLYVLHYGGHKAIIKASEKAWAHGIIMETKEHIFLILILLALMLPPFVKNSDFLKGKDSKKIVITTALLITILGLFMGYFGSIITGVVKAVTDGGL